MAGFSISGLSWTDMSTWCADHGIHGAERLRWCRLLRAMDDAAMTFAQSKR